MIKLKLSLLFLCLTLLSFTKVNAQAVEQGNIIIDSYYGVPNLLTAAVKEAYEQSAGVYDQSTLKIGTLGPIGGKVEYLVGDKTGMGVVFNYGSTSVKAITTNGYDYKASIPRYRAMLAVNFHMGDSDKFDPYFMIGGGYASGYKVKFTTNDPNAINQSIDFPVQIPVAIRFEFGARYFFIPNLGINAALGLGSGALAQFGVSGKF